MQTPLTLGHAGMWLDRAGHHTQTGEQIMIENEQQAIEMLGGNDIEGAKRRLFKDTDCGAWIEFEEDGVRIGSIVEGCDFGTAIYPLRYPFTEEAFYERIDAIEKEADDLWTWANESDMDTDAPDTSHDYEHLDPDGRSC